MSQPQLSVVIPAFNEEGNVATLVDEVLAALRGVVPFELVIVDDCSRDGTLALLQAAKARAPELRVLAHQRQSGQSTAIRTGVKAARAPWVATLDGDGQNDPADMPALLRSARETEAQGALRPEVAPAMALFRPVPGGPSLGAWLAAQAPDPRATLTAERPGLGIGLANLVARINGAPNGYRFAATGDTGLGLPAGAYIDHAGQLRMLGDQRIDTGGNTVVYQLQHPAKGVKIQP